MDSLTQFALGAGLATLYLGKTLGARKAALLGGVLGTLPDLDVFLPFADPVDAFVLHRGWTHSVIVHALAAPLIGEGLVRLVDALRGHRARVWIAVFLCLSTHAVIDAMTVYGTRLFWPLYRDPIGVGSIFIIDPLYTLPLLVVVLWSVARGGWSVGLRRGLVGALALSSAYMAVGVVVQAHITTRAKAAFAGAGIETGAVFAIAAPFNTLLWKVVALEQAHYHNLYLSVLDAGAPGPIHTHPRHPELLACLGEAEAVAKLKWFSRGYYRADRIGDRITMTDLRMGLTPAYIFGFAVAEVRNGTPAAIPPERAAQVAFDLERDLPWLGARIRGLPAARAVEVEVEAEAAVDRAGRGSAPSEPLSC